MWRVWGWLLFWKTGDMISTLMAAGKYGWGLEVNWVANIGASMFGHWFYSFYTVALVPGVLVLSYFFWEKQYYSLVEIFCLALPGVVVGNFLGFYGYIFTSFIVHSATMVMVLVYALGHSYSNHVKKDVSVWNSRWI